jgi:hypothetical protein
MTDNAVRFGYVAGACALRWRQALCLREREKTRECQVAPSAVCLREKEKKSAVCLREKEKKTRDCQAIVRAE